ncbi:MAG: desulfoferrodoxin [Erysipelotrichales bacterium]|nr:desulfoferrodoxin [Erysipelotrichales bacterium]
MAKFLICNTCNNIVGVIKDKGVPLVCCGKVMPELVANTVEASYEKHLPEVKKTEKGISVKVGSVLHPMTEEHYIDFIYVETERGGQRVKLNLEDSPEAEFCFVNDKPIAVYEYCNLHGLWKTEL